MITKKIAFLLFTFLLLISCEKDYLNIDQISNLNYNGNVTKIEFLGEYTKADAIQFLGLVNLQHKVETTCDFSLYRFQYKTHNFENTEIIVSGLMGIPNSKNIKGLLSWQHGTNSFRGGSISTPSPDEGIGLASLFAGNEYLFIAPDYIGLGTSYETQPYYHTKSTVNSVIDFLKIGEIVLNKLTNNQNNKLFLTGFSQGGGASVATQRELETTNPTNLQLAGTASISGAFNLRGISLQHTINHHTLNSVIFMCLLSNIYAQVDNQPLASFIKEPYASEIPNWFDGSKNIHFLESNLPTKVSDLFKNDFYNDLDNNVTNWFTLALDKNEMYQWKPVNKLRFYYGTKDETVIPQEAIQAYNYMNNLGGNVELKPFGPFNHDQSAIEILPEIQKWFNGL